MIEVESITVCPPSPPSSAAASLPAAFRPSAGTYLRMRREAAGLSIEAVAIAARPLSVSAIATAETDVFPLNDVAVGVLSRVVALDREIYAQLRDELPARDVCKSCACSWFDPCHSEGAPCGWYDGTATICTACAAREVAD